MLMTTTAMKKLMMNPMMLVSALSGWNLFNVPDSVFLFKSAYTPEEVGEDGEGFIWEDHFSDEDDEEDTLRQLELCSLGWYFCNTN
jgi:hypothetical protein